MDPRVKLTVFFATTVLTFTAPNSQVIMLNYMIILMLFLAAELYSGALKMFLLMGPLFLLSDLVPLLRGAPWSADLATVFLLIQKLLSFGFMGIWMVKSLKLGDLVTSLEHMHIPKGMTIAIAVAFRYLPTVRNEFHHISNTMKMRGVGLTIKNIVLHPIRSIEYVLVPLVLRSLTIADELSASAMTRGLDLKINRISYREVKLTLMDVVLAMLVFVLLAASWAIGTQGE